MRESRGTVKSHRDYEGLNNSVKALLYSSVARNTTRSEVEVENVLPVSHLDRTNAMKAPMTSKNI